MEAGGTRGLAARAGLQGAIEKALLGVLRLLLKMVEDFRAGGLAPLVPVAPVVQVATGDARADRAAESPARGREQQAARWRRTRRKLGKTTVSTVTRRGSG
jgi:hypothetical protein